MRSLLAALLLGLVLSLAAVFAVQWSAVRFAIEAVMRDHIAQGLAQDADELSTALVVVPGGGATSLAIAHFDPSFLSPASGHYYQVLVDREVVLRSPSLVDAVLAIEPVAAGQRRVADITGPHDQALLSSAGGYEIGGRPVTIAVAGDLEPVQSAFAVLRSRYAPLSLLMFALLVALQVAIVRVALAPLRRVRADVARLERGDIAQLGEAVPSEVLPLVREVNGLLGLLATRLKRSRESLGNLAHALKAPLTVLTQIADDERVRSDPVIGPQMAEQLALLQARIDSELRRARVAGRGGSGAALALGREIEALVQTMRKLHRDRALEIGCRIAPDAQFRGDREDLLELCGNLLDNACKWATSRVQVSATDGATLVLSIEDDGPGCPPGDLARIALRGVRLDESVAGHGLGLSIAEGIAASYGGEIAYGRSEDLGGFRATVRFPSSA